MRIPSGVVDQYIYFVAVDATDLKTFETGLSAFTVRRSRNGAASAAYTTPTINETDVTNMPGVYELLLDEDMTIDAGDQSQEVALRITCTGMAPVTRVFELYRPSVTDGERITVASGAVSSVTTTATATAVTTVNGLAANVITAASIATDAITAGKIAADAIGASELAADAATEIGTAVWATAARTLTANTNLNDLSAAGVRAAVGLASANLDTQLDALPTNAELSTALGTADDAVLAQIALVKSQTDLIPSDPADASVIAGRFDTLDTSIADVPTNAELATALGTADDAVLAQVALVKAKTDALPSDPADASVVAGLIAAVDAKIDVIDTTADAIKAKTDSLTFTVAGQVDSNVEYVNGTEVIGNGQTGTEWGPA